MLQLNREPETLAQPNTNECNRQYMDQRGDMRQLIGSFFPTMGSVALVSTSPAGFLLPNGQAIFEVDGTKKERGTQNEKIIEAICLDLGAAMSCCVGGVWNSWTHTTRRSATGKMEKPMAGEEDRGNMYRPREGVRSQNAGAG